VAPADDYWDWREFGVGGDGDLWIRLTSGSPHKGEWQLRGYKPRLALLGERHGRLPLPHLGRELSRGKSSPQPMKGPDR
jgi:hypothetical protein